MLFHKCCLSAYWKGDSLMVPNPGCMWNGPHIPPDFGSWFHCWHTSVWLNMSQMCMKFLQCLQVCLWVVVGSFGHDICQDNLLHVSTNSCHDLIYGMCNLELFFCREFAWWHSIHCLSVSALKWRNHILWYVWKTSPCHQRTAGVPHKWSCTVPYVPLAIVTGVT